MATELVHIAVQTLSMAETSGRSLGFSEMSFRIPTSALNWTRTRTARNLDPPKPPCFTSKLLNCKYLVVWSDFPSPSLTNFLVCLCHCMFGKSSELHMLHDKDLHFGLKWFKYVSHMIVSTTRILLSFPALVYLSSNTRGGKQHSQTVTYFLLDNTYRSNI